MGALTSRERERERERERREREKKTKLVYLLAFHDFTFIM